MKKRKRAGARGRRAKSPAHPTRPTTAKPREGRRPSRAPFVYLDLEAVGVRTTPKNAKMTAERGGKPAASSRRGNTVAVRPEVQATPPRALTYFEPVRPFQSRSEYEIVLWFGKQDAEYQRRVEEHAGVWAGIAEPPRDTLVAYLRKMSAPACPCGFDGSPRSLHVWGAKCNAAPAWQSRGSVLDDDDDYLFLSERP